MPPLAAVTVPAETARLTDALPGPPLSVPLLLSPKLDPVTSDQPLMEPRFKVCPAAIGNEPEPVRVSVPLAAPARVLPAMIVLLLPVIVSGFPEIKSNVVAAAELVSASVPLPKTIGPLPSAPVAGPGEA